MPTNMIADCRRLTSICVALWLALCAAPTLTVAAHFDYLVAQDANGRLVTGMNDFDSGNALTLPGRVFYRDLDDNFFGSDPGYAAVSPANVPAGYLALPPSTGLYFDMLAVSIGGQQVSNLWQWNGAGAVNFQPATGVTFTLTVGNASAAVNGAPAGVSGVKLQDTSATGSAHRHPGYQLTADAGGAPAEGLYLIAQQVRMPGLLNSIPYYTLFVTGAISDTTYVAAQDWARSHLVLPGDVNNDGRVDIQDITLVASHWLQAAPGGDDKFLPIGDANFDRVVDIQDITLIASHWLQTTDAPGGGALVTPVPEPATASLAATAAALAFMASARRRFARRRSRVVTNQHLPRIGLTAFFPMLVRKPRKRNFEECSHECT